MNGIMVCSSNCFTIKKHTGKKRALAGRPEVLGPIFELRALKGLHVKVGSFDVVLKLPPGLNFFLRLFEKLPPFENDIFFNGLIFLLNC